METFSASLALCAGNSPVTGHWWIPFTKASDAKLWDVLRSASWIKGSAEAGDLRPHYNVIVLIEANEIFIILWRNHWVSSVDNHILRICLCAFDLKDVYAYFLFDKQPCIKYKLTFVHLMETVYRLCFMYGCYQPTPLLQRLIEILYTFLLWHSDDLGFHKIWLYHVFTLCDFFNPILCGRIWCARWRLCGHGPMWNKNTLVI